MVVTLWGGTHDDITAGGEEIHSQRGRAKDRGA
jgi:hypothetical protein